MGAAQLSATGLGSFLSTGWHAFVGNLPAATTQTAIQKISAASDGFDVAVTPAMRLPSAHSPSIASRILATARPVLKNVDRALPWVGSAALLAVPATAQASDLPSAIELLIPALAALTAGSIMSGVLFHDELKNYFYPRPVATPIPTTAPVPVVPRLKSVVDDIKSGNPPPEMFNRTLIKYAKTHMDNLTPEDVVYLCCRLDRTSKYMRWEYCRIICDGFLTKFNKTLTAKEFNYVMYVMGQVYLHGYKPITFYPIAEISIYIGLGHDSKGTDVDDPHAGLSHFLELGLNYLRENYLRLEAKEIQGIYIYLRDALRCWEVPPDENKACRKMLETLDECVLTICQNKRLSYNSLMELSKYCEIYDTKKEIQLIAEKRFVEDAPAPESKAAAAVPTLNISAPLTLDELDHALYDISILDKSDAEKSVQFKNALATIFTIADAEKRSRLLNDLVSPDLGKNLLTSFADRSCAKDGLDLLAQIADGEDTTLSADAKDAIEKIKTLKGYGDVVATALATEKETPLPREQSAGAKADQARSQRREAE